MVLNLTVYVRNVISFFYKQKNVKFRYFNYLYQFWLIFHCKSAIWAKSTIMTSLWRHIWYVCTFLGMHGKKRPIAIPWYQISIPRAFVFQVYWGFNTPLPWLECVTKTACLLVLNQPFLPREKSKETGQFSKFIIQWAASS